jgi:uncharacterized protein YjbI with pentapeptide repeats
MADGKIDPFDVAALERSVNDSAGRVSSIWLSFVAFSAYLAAAASMISHRQIFLEEPIKLPTINIDLPLLASAILLPLLFVIYHIFVLLQVVLLSRTADTYNEAIDHGVTDEADRIRVRQRLANTLFAGSSREREGVLGWLLRAMAWITLAIAPVGVLIIFEIKFLPYHGAGVTWTHRALIAFDLLAVLMLWAGAVEPRRDIVWRSLTRHRALTAGAAAIFVLSNVLLTFPGERGWTWMTVVSPPDQASGDITPCRPAGIALVAPGFDRLVLDGHDFVDDDKLAKIIATAKTNGQPLYQSERVRSFRGRDLRCARLAGTDLRHVDFTEADLSGAILRASDLVGASFARANLAGATLDNAQLQDSSFVEKQDPSLVEKPVEKWCAGDQLEKIQLEKMQLEKTGATAQLPNASLQGAQLQRAELRGVNLRSANLRASQMNHANLESADLEAADLQSAQMRESCLINANLKAASLVDAGLEAARLDHARLQAASLAGASMLRTSLESAWMQGASLRGAQMMGAKLDDANMQGAVFDETELVAVTFRRNKLQGAVFGNTHFEATVFLQARLQGVEFGWPTGRRSLRAPGLLDTIVSGSFLWHAGDPRCSSTHVMSPNFEEVVEANYAGGVMKTIAANDRAISEFVAQSIAEVPDSSKFLPEFSKGKLREDLTARLRAANSGDAWKACLAASEARTPDEFQQLAGSIVDYACQYADMNPFVSAFADNGEQWTSDLAHIPIGKMFAQSLLTADAEQCPGVKILTDQSKTRLQRLADPG